MKTVQAIILGLLVGAIILAALILLKVEPFTRLPAFVMSLAGLKDSFTLTGIVDMVKANWQIIAPVATIAGTAIPLVYKWIQARHTAQQAVAAAVEMERSSLANQVQSSQQASQLRDEVTRLNTELAAYKSDSSLSEAESLISSQATQIQGLRSQMETLQTEPARLIEQLWQNSGGKTVEQDGKLYRIIELVREIVK